MLELCGGARFVGYAAIRFGGCVFVTAAGHPRPFDADLGMCAGLGGIDWQL